MIPLPTPALLRLPTASPSTATAAIVRANSEFGAKLFASTDLRTGNSLLSPISLTSNLRLLVVGAGGETRKLLTTAMGLGSLNDQQIEAGSADLENGISQSEVSMANSLWVAPGISINPGYADAAKSSFGGSIEALTGTGAAGADQINTWVSDHTKGRITQLFRTLGSDPALVLANAVTFDGKWQLPFPARGTRPKPFYGSTKQADVPTMSVTGEIQATEADGVQFVRLPYTGQSSFWIAMPKAGTDPGSVVGTLLSPPSLPPARSVLFLPKFTFEDRPDIQSGLSKLGLRQIFRHSDLKGISSDRRLGKISQIVQKTFIKVDEKGTEAAAATGIVVSPTAVMRPPSIQIHIDHPFALAIRDDATGTLLFLGVVRNLE